MTNPTPNFNNNYYIDPNGNSVDLSPYSHRNLAPCAQNDLLQNPDYRTSYHLCEEASVARQRLANYQFQPSEFEWQRTCVRVMWDAEATTRKNLAVMAWRVTTGVRQNAGI
ncbi:hypothetical protein LTR35_004320 [Friedmanniomyces endolithicus]|nr:hypothetical protein LTS00_013717 [Friedmanniomyces endolithicus]KAK0286851.1 hypothetical protein LTR35_004320 [Friedmanniomyces endolithicus]KAK1017543.1 hypothetical protein LTR54_002201 [Friedmanniomyces endolithicus]